MKLRSYASSLLRGALVLAVALTLGACSEDSTLPSPTGGGGQGRGGRDAGGSGGLRAPGEIGEAPVLSSSMSLGDDELAQRALTLLGSAAVGAEGSCRNCHSLGRATLTRWQASSSLFVAECASNGTLSDQSSVDAMVACFRARSQKPSGAFTAAQFGIYSAAAHLPWFTFLFEHATEFSADWQAEHDLFIDRVGMPRAGRRFSQGDFDVVAEWFSRGLPRLFDLVPEEAGEDCTPGLAPSLFAHVSDMQVAGWRAQNEQVPLLMFGCDAGEAGADCLSEYTLARDTSFGSQWDGASDTHIRILHDNSASLSTYWSRASADGRYIGAGLLDAGALEYSGQIVDLQRDATINVDFTYDATFFPDNSGFLVQRGGSSSGGGPPGAPSDGSANSGDTAIVCEQSLLAAGPESISGEEAACNRSSGRIGLYQQLAKSLDGDDYWVVHGSYEGDDGGFSPVRENPSAAFDAQSSATLTPMFNQGNGYEPGSPLQMQTPQQGDPMLSPSGRLLVTRVKGQEYTIDAGGFEIVAAEQSGYALHLVSMSREGDVWSASLEDVGRVCFQGGKAVFSYDERWMVFHHYVTEADAIELGFSGASDPGFSEYTELGASNLYLVDLTTGDTQRITETEPGQYALFPHFRSDGWIYFVVRTVEGEEFFAASDAALLSE